MQKRAKLIPNPTENYIPDFPELEDFTRERNATIYEILGKIPTSEYFGLCAG